MSNNSRRAFFGTAAGAAALAGGCSRAVPAVEAQKKDQTPSPKLELLEFQPKSMLVVPEHSVARAKFPVIDVHTHISGVFGRKRETDPAVAFKQLDDIVKWSTEINLKTAINLTGGWGDDLKRNVNDLQERYEGHFVNCITPAWDRTREPGYSKWQADELANAKKIGAVGLKVMKTLGLYLRENGKEGPLVKIDDPRFDPMWEAAGQLNLPVFIHTADPDAFFTPIDRFNERWEELGNHPEWSFYGKDYPAEGGIAGGAQSRHRAPPKTTFVGLHVANHPENLDDVCSWLDEISQHARARSARGWENSAASRGRRASSSRNTRTASCSAPMRHRGKAGMPQQDLGPAMYQTYFRLLETLDEYFDYAPSAGRRRGVGGSTASACPTRS